jgi:hypothetical protein
VKKKISTGREDVHPQNGLNGLILNWCIGGCWFTPALKRDSDMEHVKAEMGPQSTVWFFFTTTARALNQDIW